METKYVVLGGSVAIALVVGGAGGYFFAKTQLEEHYADLASQEISKARDYYKTLNKRGDFETPQAAVEKLIPKTVTDAIKLYKGTDVVPDRGGEIQYQRAELRTDVGTLEIEEPVQLSVFKEVTQEHVLVEIDKEIRNRTEEAPYIISAEEFFADEAGHSQITLTYYEGDGVLVDEREEPLEDIDQVVGDDNIPRFGHRSNDPNVVYVRNHVLGSDFEVCRSKLKYAEQIGLKAK